MSDNNTIHWKNNKRVIKLHFHQIIEPGNYIFYLEYKGKGTRQDLVDFFNIQKLGNV